MKEKYIKQMYVNSTYIKPTYVKSTYVKPLAEIMIFDDVIATSGENQENQGWEMVVIIMIIMPSWT